MSIYSFYTHFHHARSYTGISFAFSIFLSISHSLRLFWSYNLNEKKLWRGIYMCVWWRSNIHEKSTLMYVWMYLCVSLCVCEWVFVCITECMRALVCVCVCECRSFLVFGRARALLREIFFIITVSWMLDS